jgi:hypothetical protein
MSKPRCDVSGGSEMTTTVSGVVKQPLFTRFGGQ